MQKVLRESILWSTSHSQIVSPFIHVEQLPGRYSMMLSTQSTLPAKRKRMRSIEAGRDERAPWIHESEPSKIGRQAWSACKKVLCREWLRDRMRTAGEQASPRWTLANFLLLFALFFVVERLAGMVPASYFEIDEADLPWIQVLYALVASAAASAVLPSMRIVRQNRGLAEKEQARFLAAMERSLDDFYIFDGIADETGRIVDFRFSYINPNAERRLGVRRDTLIGKPLTEFRPYMTRSGLIEKYQEVVRTGQALTCEVYIDDERIKETWLSLQVVKLGDGLAITSRDVTASRHMAEHIQRLAHYDQLTGLANRALLQDRLHQAIIRARRYKHKVALLVVDIDHFKGINDSLGHSAGDSLLVAAGQRLLSSIRETDTVARMGGDEFVVVMPDFKSMEDVKRCGAQIVKAASEPIDLGDREIRITVSVGVCTFPDFAEDEKRLFKNADAAMYVVKNNSRNGVHVFNEDSPAGPTMKIGDAELHSPKTPSGF
jgi:diguanylate cyclase (GGDEF)-like protein